MSCESLTFLIILDIIEIRHHGINLKSFSLVHVYFFSSSVFLFPPVSVYHTNYS